MHVLNYLWQEIHSKKEEEHKLLKDELRRELLITAPKSMEYLKLVDVFERLGVAYHFEKTIEDTLKQINDFEKQGVEKDNDDLYHTSLMFRILRQHRYCRTSGTYMYNMSFVPTPN